MIEEMREAYKRCKPLLSTEKQQEASEEKIRQAFKEQLLLIAGFKEEEIGKIDFSKTSDEEFQKMVREKLLGAMANNGNRQKSIVVGDLDDHLAKGWEFVASLPDEITA